GSFLLVDPVSAADLEAALLRIEAERATFQPQVLLVDAIGTFTAGLWTAFRPFSDLAVLEDPRRLFATLSERKPHALIVASDLGGWSGFDLCRLRRGTRARPPTAALRAGWWPDGAPGTPCRSCSSSTMRRPRPASLRSRPAPTTGSRGRSSPR